MKEVTFELVLQCRDNGATIYTVHIQSNFWHLDDDRSSAHKPFELLMSLSVKQSIV